MIQMISSVVFHFIKIIAFIIVAITVTVASERSSLRKKGLDTKKTSLINVSVSVSVFVSVICICNTLIIKVFWCSLTAFVSPFSHNIHVQKCCFKVTSPPNFFAVQMNMIACFKHNIEN